MIIRNVFLLVGILLIQEFHLATSKPLPEESSGVFRNVLKKIYNYLAVPDSNMPMEGKDHLSSLEVLVAPPGLVEPSFGQLASFSSLSAPAETTFGVLVPPPASGFGFRFPVAAASYQQQDYQASDSSSVPGLTISGKPSNNISIHPVQQFSKFVPESTKARPQKLAIGTYTHKSDYPSQISSYQ